MIYKNSAQALAYQNLVLTKITQEKYIKYFEKDDVVLDLGCVGGIFMELLKMKSVHGIGVDIVPDIIRNCKNKGFEAYEDDILHFLNSFDKLYDGIFCSHIVEHLTPQNLIKLFRLARKRIKPLGKLIIITPNPKNLNVLRDIFWQDLTHIRPYPLLVLERLGNEYGFSVADKGEEPIFFNPFIKGTARKAAIFGLLKKWLSFGLFNRGNLFMVFEKN